MKVFEPSPEQQAVFDAVLSTKDNIAISALAGTGKTTTLVELARKLPAAGSKLFCAFNKDIVSELERKLTGTGMKALTFHALGRAALVSKLGNSLKLEAQKYRNMVREWTDTSIELRSIIGEAIRSGEINASEFDLTKATGKLATELIRFMCLMLADPKDPEALRRIVYKYALDEDTEGIDAITELVIAQVPGWMKKSEAMVLEQKIIDFTDMIYFPVVWNLPVTKYQWVFVDECQDLSAMQREMVKKVLANDGRIVLVGDKNQAIYAFAGADSDSFDLSVAAFKALVLPLTLTRRCYSIVTHHAAQLVPGFVCPPDKERGKIIWTGDETMLKVVEPSNMILCRIKAPLVSACLEFLSNGIPATILGADIAKALVAILEKLKTRKDYTFARLLDVLQSHENQQVARFMKRGDESAAENIRDQCEALRVVIERVNAPNEAVLSTEIQKLFSDHANGKIITLATVHKSKGLEAERVFLLQPDKFISFQMRASGEQGQQEKNLDYVARTRAVKELIYFTNEKFLKYMKDRGGRPSYVQSGFEDTPVETPQLLPPVANPSLFDLIAAGDKESRDPNAVPAPVVFGPGFDDAEYEDDRHRLLVDNVSVPAIEGTTWGGVKAGLAQMGVPSVLPEPEATTIEAPEFPAQDFESLVPPSETSDIPEAPAPVEVAPIIVPVPVVPVTRDLRKDMANKATAEALTTERQKLVDLVMTLDMAQINAMTAILQAAATIKSGTDVAVGA